MPVLERSITIQASPEQVWAVLADFGGVANWVPSIARSSLLGQGPPGLGCERRCETTRLGAVRERVVEWTEGEALSYELSQATRLVPLRQATNRWSVRAAEGGGAIVTTRGTLEPAWGPVGAALIVVLLPWLRRQQRAALAGLKRHVEARPAKRVAV